MPRKTKIIFIVVFILIGGLTLWGYLYFSKGNSTTSNTATDTGYKPFLGTSNSTGQSTDQTNTSSDTGDTAVSPSSGSETAVSPSRFTKITNFAVAGATFFEDSRPVPTATADEQPTPTKTTTKAKATIKVVAPKFELVPSIRYVERATGHISQMYLDTKASGEISNSTIPNIYETFFDKTASSVLYRYLSDDGKTITSFLASLGGTKGEFLASNILDISVSPDGTKFFYLTKTYSGSVGSIRSFKDTKKTMVFTSSLQELLSQWVTDQKIYLTTKASASVNGTVFSLNTVSGVLTKLLGGVPGLTTLANKDGSVILYSTSTSRGPKLQLFDTKTHSTKDLGLYSLPEKCVWNETRIYCATPHSIGGNQLPDSWYQGTTSFDDYFVKIDSQTGQVSSLASGTPETPVDGTHLFLNKQESTLFFINKKDSTLWSLEL